MKSDARSSMGHAISKVPRVTLGFWIIKVAATTLGETAGDWVTMSLKLGYLIGTTIFAVIFLSFISAQIKVARFHPCLYWATIIATTTIGTTLADFLDRSIGVGYTGGTAIVLALLLGSLAIWYKVEGSVAVESVSTPRVEWFYWITILFSQTLGTALGDWAADPELGGFGHGYEYAALIFATGLVLVMALYFWTAISRTALFWAAFILTRPLGATLGDLLDKPLAQGGLNISRGYVSLLLLAFILLCIAIIPQRPAEESAVG